MLSEVDPGEIVCSGDPGETGEIFGGAALFSCLRAHCWEDAHNVLEQPNCCLQLHSSFKLSLVSPAPLIYSAGGASFLKLNLVPTKLFLLIPRSKIFAKENCINYHLKRYYNCDNND